VVKEGLALVVALGRGKHMRQHFLQQLQVGLLIKGLHARRVWDEATGCHLKPLLLLAHALWKDSTGREPLRWLPVSFISAIVCTGQQQQQLGVGQG
jgi:hypothetical protein